MLTSTLHFLIWTSLDHSFLINIQCLILSLLLALLLPPFPLFALMLFLRPVSLIQFIRKLMKIFSPKTHQDKKDTSKTIKDIPKFFTALQTIIDQQIHQDKENTILGIGWSQLAPKMGLEPPLPNPSTSFPDLLMSSISSSSYGSSPSIYFWLLGSSFLPPLFVVTKWIRRI